MYSLELPDLCIQHLYPGQPPTAVRDSLGLWEILSHQSLMQMKSAFMEALESGDLLVWKRDPPQSATHSSGIECLLACAGRHLPAGHGPAQGEHAGAGVLRCQEAQVQACHPVPPNDAGPS